MISKSSEPRKRLAPPGWLPGVIRKLYSFSELRANWDGYGAAQPKLEILLSAMNLASQLAEDNAVLAPAAFPTRIGGVLLSWKKGSHQLEVQFVSRDTASFVYLNKDTNEVLKGDLFPENNGQPFWFTLNRHFAE